MASECTRPIRELDFEQAQQLREIDLGSRESMVRPAGRLVGLGTVPLANAIANERVRDGVRQQPPGETRRGSPGRRPQPTPPRSAATADRIRRIATSRTLDHRLGVNGFFTDLAGHARIRIAGIDDLDLYLAVSTSHDGSLALRVDATPVRVVCANTQRLAFKRSVGHYTFPAGCVPGTV